MAQGRAISNAKLDLQKVKMHEEFLQTIMASAGMSGGGGIYWTFLKGPVMASM